MKLFDVNANDSILFRIFFFILQDGDKFIIKIMSSLQVRTAW